MKHKDEMVDELTLHELIKQCPTRVQVYISDIERERNEMEDIGVHLWDVLTGIKIKIEIFLKQHQDILR